MKDKIKKHYLIYIGLFVGLNILNTFVVTTQALNRYIVPFDYSLGGIINSIIGNLAVIVLFMLLFSLVIKKPKSKIIVTLVASFLLNFLLFWSNIYNRYYGTSFSIRALAIFRNPSEGFGLTIAFEAFRELITYYRIILFLPTIILAIYAYKLIKLGVNNIEVRKIRLKPALSKALLIVILSITNISLFLSGTQGVEIIDSAMPTYATQNIGIYQYYFLELVGFDGNESIKKHDYSEVMKTLDEFNKNKDGYYNIIDGKYYSKNVTKNNAVNLSGKLVDSLAEDDSLTGILEDYNLVLIHLESFNNFLLQIPESRAHLKNLTSILEESYVFNNFYTNVGLGNSFDAEIAVLAGLNANGTSTLGWDFDKEIPEKNFQFQTIPKMFNELGYSTNSMHGNTNIFYNRINAHPDMFGISNLYFREQFILDNGFTLDETTEALAYFAEESEHFANAWISDRLVFKEMNKQINAFNEKDERFMMYAITMLPHTPYLYDPYHENANESMLYEHDYLQGLNKLTIRYLNYLKYYDEIFRIILEDVNGYGDSYEFNEDNLYNHKKVAYVFYGDHGSGLSNGDLSVLLNKELTPIEERKELLKTLSFIYVPGDEINSNNIRTGLLKGNQNLVRGQTDLYRTIVDLFNLPIKNDDYLYGVHGMSSEPTYSIDNRTGDVITDNIVFSLRNVVDMLVLEEHDLEVSNKVREEIIRFKQASDTAINKNLYAVLNKEQENLSSLLSYRGKINK